MSTDDIETNLGAKFGYQFRNLTHKKRFYL